MKILTTLVQRIIAPILEREGFDLKEGDRTSFVKRIPNERELHVEIQELGYVDGISVNLQDLSWDGKQARVRSLERLAGIRHYSYGRGTSSEIEHAVNAAANDLETFGLKWLRGEDVRTPATERAEQLSREHRYAECIRQAREAFKHEDYNTALILFSEAAELQPLDDVSARFRQIATNRATKD